jgi:hypothetical protein
MRSEFEPALKWEDIVGGVFEMLGGAIRREEW